MTTALQSNDRGPAGRRSRGLRDRHLKYLLVLPAVTVVVATAIWPLVDSFILSFRFWKLSRSNVPGPFVGLENYLWALVEEPAFWNAVWVTGLYTVLTVGFTTLFALGVALLLAPGGGSGSPCGPCSSSPSR